MNDKTREPELIEIERYELFSRPAYNFAFDRRQFMKVFSGGIALIIPLSRVIARGVDLDPQGESGRGAFNRRLPNEIGAWLHIDQEGGITVYTGKVEFGQDIRTSLTQAVADELHAPVAQIRIVMGDTDLTPYDAGTFGSRTTPAMAPQLRKAAAAARELLIDLAAKQLNVERDTVQILNARFVNHDATKSLSFAEVTKGEKLVKVIPEDVATTPVSEWRIAGTSVRKVDGRNFVTGKHLYTSDLKRPGMLHARVVRPSSFKATLVSADTKAAEAIAGVKLVRDGDFLAVAAPSQSVAFRAAGTIKAEWKSSPQPSTSELFDLLKRPVGGERPRGGSGPRVQGSIKDGMAAADKQIEQSYTVAYIAHAPLEPRAALAEWQDNKLTVWTGTQRPFGVRSELAEAFRLPEESVRVIVPDTGSGYGGKHSGECAIEAARIARATGQPVRLVWSREEEFTWAYFRPAGVIEIKSGVRNDGKITAWEFHNYNSGGSAIQGRYDIPNQHLQFHPAESPLRQGSYRALAATANHFARESHMDELAHALKIDPLQFRLLNSSDERLRAVLQAAAKAFGWEQRKMAAGRGAGIACGFEKGGFVATCAEVAVERKTGKVNIVRLVEAFECGAVVNPDHLKNQIEGSIIMGLGGALFESIEFENGKILNSRFSRYRVPRFSDVPPVEVVILNRKDLPSAGAGETPIVGVAPAIGNAIFEATGVRLRSLPMVPKGEALSSS
ncbi:MAG TPA: molybdopterin cofactor-binding domain-containing protein [Pyrinomonadaceae bacterium]|nr:molybdopterin cofactor-binding domain-containing protein [Pyrinomonadaceae bacterium]